MKQLLGAVIFMMAFSVSGQYAGDARVDEAFQVVRREGLQRGVNIDSLLLRAVRNGYPVVYTGYKVVDTIKIRKKPGYEKFSLNPGAITRFDIGDDRVHYRCLIEIESDNLIYKDIAEAAIAHEIGHVLGLEHEPKEVQGKIMSEIAYKGSWDYYFDKLKALYNLEPQI